MSTSSEATTGLLAATKNAEKTRGKQLNALAVKTDDLREESKETVEKAKVLHRKLATKNQYTEQMKSASLLADLADIGQVILAIIEGAFSFRRSRWNIIAWGILALLALAAFGIGFGLTFTGVMSPIGIAMAYGGIGLAASIMGLAGFAITAVAGLIFNECLHRVYVFTFDGNASDDVKRQIITNPALADIQQQKTNSQAATEEPESFSFNFCNWLSRDKVKSQDRTASHQEAVDEATTSLMMKKK